MRQRPIRLRCLSSRKRRQGAREHLPGCPSSVRSSRRQSFRTLTIALRQQSASSLSWLHKRHAQRSMGTHKMVVGTPPLQIGQQLRGRLCGGPGPAGQSCPPAFRMVRFTRSIKAVFSRPEKPIPCKEARISGLCPEPHYVRDSHQLAPPVDCLHLTIVQIRCYLPSKGFAPTTPHRSKVVRNNL